MRGSYRCWMCLLSWLAVAAASGRVLAEPVPLTLVEQGQPRATIMLGQTAGSTEITAAGQLVEIIRSITGATLPVTRLPDSPAAGPQIILGTPRTHAMVADVAGRLGLDGVSDEQIVILREGDRLYLCGNKPVGAMFACFAFLENDLGVRWYWPGESGTYLPRMDSIHIGRASLNRKPAFPQSGYKLTYGSDPQTELWHARNRLRLARNLWAWSYADRQINQQRYADSIAMGIKPIVSGHCLGLDPDRYFAAHPEYFMLAAGKRHRGWSICWSCPPAREMLLEMLRSWMRDYPEVEELHVYLPDETQRCQCEECLALADDASGRYFKFLDGLIQEVRRDYPHAKFSTLAYQEYMDVPAVVKPTPGMVVHYCAYNRCYKHPLESDCKANVDYLGQLKKWLALGQPMAIYGYEYDALVGAEGASGVMIPNVRMMADQLRAYRRLGIQHFGTQCPIYAYNPGSQPQDRPWTQNRLSLYVGAKLLVDPDQNVDDILLDWTTRIFGPAGPSMLAYYRLVEDAWLASPNHLTYFLHEPASSCDGFMSDELCRRVRKLFDEADQSLSNLKGQAGVRMAEQVQLERGVWGRWEQVFRQWKKTKRSNRLEVPHVACEPPVGGEKPDAIWQRAVVQERFLTVTGEPPVDATAVQALWSDQALHLRVTCRDGDMASLSNTHTTHDSLVWDDDCVELFVDPDGAGRYFHLAVNSSGATCDAVGTQSPNSWNGAWSAVTFRTQDGWTVEITLPFVTFGQPRNEGEPWRLGVNRTRRGNKPHSSWTDGTYRNPASFLPIHMVK
ncbi:MAG: DUF4838 domain-containing protein [Phycisphaeraceae bacterium]|nr:DUF4838 domain-containing protein [Phycisphaeraceae bacterium]